MSTKKARRVNRSKRRNTQTDWQPNPIAVAQTIISAAGESFSNSVKAAMAKSDDYKDRIESIRQSGPYQIVTLRNGTVFQIMDPVDIPAVIKEMGERAEDNYKPPAIVVGFPTPTNTYPAGYARMTPATRISDPKVVEDINKRSQTEFHKRAMAMSMDDDLSAKALARLRMESGISRSEMLKSQAEYDAETKFVDRMADKFSNRPTMPVRCDWCQTIFKWSMNSGPKVCSGKCGDKLAKLLLEHPEIDKLPSVKRSIQIQAYRSLDSAESFNDDQ